ncbi:MAG: hypothetical protein JST39_23750 [Bacteroidetes bacterium]|nr:hypothetical protein [Bacteroidota bacterium]
MKRIIVVALVAFFGTSLYANPIDDISEKVLRIFKTTFSNAQDVKWTEYDDKYVVSFSQDGIQSKVTYDKDGDILSSLRYYSPDRLPVAIYGKLKKKYEDRTLYGVTESANEQEIYYYVKMYDAKNWYTIKIDASGSMETYEKLKRADHDQFPEKKRHSK